MGQIRLVAPVNLTMQGQKIVDLGEPTADTDGARFADLPSELIDLNDIVEVNGGPDGITIVEDSTTDPNQGQLDTLRLGGIASGTLGDIRIVQEGTSTIVYLYEDFNGQHPLPYFLQNPNNTAQWVELSDNATVGGLFLPLLPRNIHFVTITNFDFTAEPSWDFLASLASASNVAGTDLVFQNDELFLTLEGTLDGTIKTEQRLHGENDLPYLTANDIDTSSLQGPQGRYSVSIFIDVTNGSTPATPAASTYLINTDVFNLPADDVDHGAWSFDPPTGATVTWESRAQVNPSDFSGNTYTLTWGAPFEAGERGATGAQGFQGDSASIALTTPAANPGDTSILTITNTDVDPATGVATVTDTEVTLQSGSQGVQGENLTVFESSISATTGDTTVTLETAVTGTPAGSFVVERGEQGAQGTLNFQLFLGQTSTAALPVDTNGSTRPTGEYYFNDFLSNLAGDVVINAEPAGWVFSFADALTAAGGSAAVDAGTGAVYQSNFTVNPGAFVITGPSATNFTDWEGTSPFLTGLQGPPGDPGPGLPPGGLPGQVARKIDDTDFNTEWFTIEAIPNAPLFLDEVNDDIIIDSDRFTYSIPEAGTADVQLATGSAGSNHQFFFIAPTGTTSSTTSNIFYYIIDPNDNTNQLGPYELRMGSVFASLQVPFTEDIEDGAEWQWVRDAILGRVIPTGVDITYWGKGDIYFIPDNAESVARFSDRVDTQDNGAVVGIDQLSDDPLNYAVGTVITEGSIYSWEEDGDSFTGVADEIQHSSTVDDITTTGTEVSGRFPSVLIEEVPVADYTDWITADADTIPNHLVIQELAERGRNIVVEIDVASTVNGSTADFRDVTATVVEERVASTTTGQVVRYTVTSDSAAEITTGGSWNIIELADVNRKLTHIIQNADETINVTSDITVGRQLLVGNIGSSVGGSGFQIHVSDDAPFEATTSVVIAVGAFEATFGVVDRRDIEDAVAALEIGERLYFVLDTVPVTPNGVISDEEGAVYVFDSITNVNTVNFSRVDGITADSASPGNDTTRTFRFFSGIETEPDTVLITDNLEVFRDTTFNGPVTFTNTATGLTTASLSDFDERVGILTNPASTTHTRLQHEITIVGDTTVDSGENYTAPASIAPNADIDVTVRIDTESFSSLTGVLHVDLTSTAQTNLESIAIFNISDLGPIVTAEFVIDGDDLVAGATYDVVYRTVGHGGSITFISNVDFDFESGGLFVKTEVEDYIEDLIESYGDGTRQDLHTNYLTGAEIAAHYLSGNVDHAEGTLSLISPFEPDNTNFQSNSDAYVDDEGDRVGVVFAFNSASVRQQDFHTGRIFLIQFNDGEATATFSQVYRARVFFNNPGLPGDVVAIYANLIDDNNELINPLSAVSDTDTTTVLAALTALSNGTSFGNILFDAGQVELSLDLSTLPSIFESTLGVEVPSLNGFLPQGGTFASKFTLFFGTPSAGTEVTVSADGGDVLRTPEVYTTSGRDWYWWSDLIITDTTISVATDNAGLWTSSPDPDNTTGIRFNLIG